MEFEDAAAFFDKTPVYDGYTGALLFYGRTSTHDDHSSAGATSRRRTLTAEPASVAPARGVVNVHDELWLVGTSNVDNFLGDQIRRNFDLKKSNDRLTYLTPAQAALELAGPDFYARLEFYRDQTDTMTSASYDTMWNVFCPSSEPLQVGLFLRGQDGRLLRIRNYYQAQERLHIVEADQLDAGAARPARFTHSTLDIATDRRYETSIETSVVAMDVSKFYQNQTKSDSDYQPGDLTVFLAQSVLTPKVGDEFEMSGATWRVKQVVAELDAWSIRARLA